MYVYAGTFVLALAMLALEITLTRVLSVVTWYHLAFFAISAAMLGMTAGATKVYLHPKRFAAEKLSENLGWACLRFALAVPVGLLIVCITPATAAPTIMSLVTVLVLTAAFALPFYYAGIAITLVLTKCTLPVGKVYASDLLGASLGCFFVLGGLGWLDAPSLILLCGAIGALAGFIFLCAEVRNERKGERGDGLIYSDTEKRRQGAKGNSAADGGLAVAPSSFSPLPFPLSPQHPKRLRRANLIAFACLTLLAIVNSRSSVLVRPLMVKGAVVPGAPSSSLSGGTPSPALRSIRWPTVAPRMWAPSPLAPPLRKISGSPTSMAPAGR